jgi:hypothetical protein
LVSVVFIAPPSRRMMGVGSRARQGPAARLVRPARSARRTARRARSGPDAPAAATAAADRQGAPMARAAQCRPFAAQSSAANANESIIDQGERAMTHHRPRLSTAVLAACLALAGIAASASANNRAFPAVMASAADPSTASCFNSYGNGVTLQNHCSNLSSIEVLLPMAADNAGWYAESVYGRGWRDQFGNIKTINCQGNSAFASGGFFWGPWTALPQDGSFGGAQAIHFPYSSPVYGPGDTLFALCWMDFNTSIFSYGWN